MSKAKAERVLASEAECPDEGILTNYLSKVADPPVSPKTRNHIEACPTCQASLDILVLESDPFGAKLRQADQFEPHFSETSKRVDAILHRARRDSVDGKAGDVVKDAAPSFKAKDKLTVTSQLEVDAFHSEGGLGQVWKSTDDFGRTLALKVIKPNRVRDPLVRRRFLREARLTAMLTHPSIVTVHGAGANECDEPFYSMNFVDGVTLESVIDGHPESRVKHLQSFIDVCNAIHYAHERRVIHRDIKPKNILLGKHGETTVVDWGLARFIDESPDALGDSLTASEVSTQPQMTEHGSRMGTPEYMSPEQASTDSGIPVGPLSDVYSLGATLYAILTGKAPFEGNTQEVCEKVQRGEFVPPSQMVSTIPRALEAICLKAMAVLPTDRYQSANELLKDIQEWLEDRPVAAYPEPFSAKAGRWLKRHRTFASVSAATVLVATLALGVELTRARAANRELTQLNIQLKAAQNQLEKNSYSRGYWTRALDVSKVALRRAEQQYSKDPIDENQLLLIRSWSSVALAQHKSGRLHLATRSYKVALEHLEHLLTVAPDNTDYLEMRIGILGNRGMTDLVLSGPDKAADTYVDAIESVEEVIKVAGVSIARTREAARLNGNLANAVAVTDDKERELRHRRRAIGLLKELVVEHQQEGLEQFIGVHAVRLTMTLLRLQRDDEALRELQDIIKYCEQIESGEQQNWGQQFDAAECLAFLSQHEPNRFKSDVLAGRAVTVLREMRENGFFVSQPQLIDRMRSEPRLAQLRVRPDYIELLKALERGDRT